MKLKNFKKINLIYVSILLISQSLFASYMSMPLSYEYQIPYLTKLIFEGTDIKKLRDNPKFLESYNQAIVYAIELAVKSCNRNLSDSERRAAILEMNKAKIQGEFGTKYSKLVEQLNSHYVFQDGSFSSKGLQENTGQHLVDFFHDNCNTRQDYLGCLRLASESGIQEARAAHEFEIKNYNFDLKNSRHLSDNNDLPTPYAHHSTEKNIHQDKQKTARSNIREEHEEKIEQEKNYKSKTYIFQLKTSNNNLAVISNSQSNAQRILASISVGHNLSLSNISQTALKQQAKSYEAAQKILNSNSASEIRKLMSWLRDSDFLLCYDHIEKVFENSPIAAIDAEDRLLNIMNDPEALTQIDKLTLSKCEYLKEQIGNAKLAQAICQKILTSKSEINYDRVLLDLWYKAQNDSDLKNRITRRTHSDFAIKVADIMKEQLHKINLNRLERNDLIKVALQMHEMIISNSTFLSSLNKQENDKLQVIINNCETVLSKLYNRDLRTLETIQRRLQIRGSEILYTTTSSQQIEMQKKIIDCLFHITTTPYTSELDQQIIYDIAQVSINLSKENKLTEANQAIDILDSLSRFKDGTLDYFSEEASNLKKHWKSTVAMGAGHMALAYFCPPAAVIVGTTMLGVGIINDSAGFFKSVQTCYDAIEKGDYFALGKESTKLGINAFFLLRTYNHMFKDAKARGQLAQLAQEFNDAIRTVSNVNNLIHELSKTAEYAKLMQNAINAGMSLETWKNSIKRICSTCDNIRDVIRFISEMGHFIAESQNFVPRGYGRQIKVDLHHSFFGINKKGKISGYHSTAIVNPSNSNNIRILRKDTNSNGISRILVQIGNGKPKEKTIWPDNWSPAIIWDKYKEILHNLDFNNFKPIENSESFSQNITFQGIETKIIWDPKTSTISNIFPFTEEWLADFGSWERAYRNR